MAECPCGLQLGVVKIYEKDDPEFGVALGLYEKLADKHLCPLGHSVVVVAFQAGTMHFILLKTQPYCSHKSYNRMRNRK